MSGILSGAGAAGLLGGSSSGGGLLGGLNMTMEQKIEMGAKLVIGADPGMYLGPLIMGLAVDLTLLGVVLHQLITWVSTIKTERRFVAALVIIAVCGTIAQSCYGLYEIFHLFVYNFGQYTPILDIQRTAWVILFAMITVATVQVFYLERAYRLLHNSPWVLICLGPFIAAGFGGAMWAMITGLQLKTFLDAGKFNQTAYVWLGATLAADLLLTGVILFGLWRNKTGWSDTDRLIHKLVKVSLESQIPSTVTAIAFMISYGIKPSSFMTAFWELFHPKVYVVALLGVLNSRVSLKRDVTGGLTQSSSGGKRDNTFGPASSSRFQQETVVLDDIRVKTEVDYYESRDTSPGVRVGVNRRADSEDGTVCVDRDSDPEMGRLGRLPTNSRTRLTSGPGIRLGCKEEV